jgi:peroxiredoxin
MKFMKTALGIYQAIIGILLTILVIIVIFDICFSSSNSRYHWNNIFLAFLLVLPTIIFCLCNSFKMLISKNTFFEGWKSLTQVSIVFTVLCTMFLGYLLIFETAWGNRQMSIPQNSSLQVGQMAPDFNAVDQFGQKISLYELRGKIVLIDFWATWCGPCLEELPNIHKIWERYHNNGLVVIGISLDKEEGKIREFLDEGGFLYSHVWDKDRQISDSYKVVGVPTVFLIDKKGQIVSVGDRGHRLIKSVENLMKRDY